MSTSTLALAIDNLAATLSNVAAFRTFCGVDEEEDPVAAALARIHKHKLPPPADNADTHTRAELETYRPFAQIRLDDRDSSYRRGVMSFGDGGEFEASGRLILWIERDAVTDARGDADDDDAVAFVDEVTTIMDQFGVLSGQDGRFNAHEITLITWGVAHPQVKPQEGVFFVAVVGIGWEHSI